MIFTERNITIRNDSATINAPVILYRGDKNVEVRFTLVESPYKYSNRDSINIIESTDASYAQLVIKTPNDREPIFGDITAVGQSNVTFVIGYDMIDEIEEVGTYDFQIRLFDADQTSMATIPEVVSGFIIKEPIAKEDTNNNITNSAIVGSAVVTNDLEIPTFVGDSYNKTAWHDGDVISKQKLNKMEDGIYETYELSKNNNSLIKDKVSKSDAGVITPVMLSQEVKEQMTGGSVAVVGENAVLEPNIVDGQVTKRKTSFYKKSINLFGRDLFVKGKGILTNNGQLYDNPDLSAYEEYVPISCDYISYERFTLGGVSDDPQSSSIGVTFYDVNKAWIIFSNIKSREYAQVPSGAKYIRLHINNLYLEESNINVLPSKEITGTYLKQYELEDLSEINTQITQLNNEIVQLKDGSSIRIGAIKPDKTTFFNIRKNLFDATTAVVGAIYKDSGNFEASFDTWQSTDWIEVKAGTTIYFSNNGESYTISTGALYDNNKQYISGLNDINSTVVQQDGYMRVSKSGGFPDKFQIEVGRVTGYKEFGVEEVSLKPEYFSDMFNVYKNLFDVSTVVVGAILKENGILEPTFDQWRATDWIEVKAGTTIYFSKDGEPYITHLGALYDTNKNYLSPINDVNSVKVLQDGYMRVSQNGGFPDKYQIEIDQITKYKEFGVEEIVLKPEYFGDIINKIGNKYEGKNYLLLGDSITALGNNPYGWEYHFRNIMKPNKVVNISVNGCTWKDKADTPAYDGNPVPETNLNVIGNQVQKVINQKASGNTDYDNFDVIIIACGTNDSYDTNNPETEESIESEFVTGYGANNFAVKPLESVNRKTFAGIMRYTYEKRYELYPNAVFFVTTPLQEVYESYKSIKAKGDLIDAVADRLSINTINTRRCGILNLYESPVGDIDYDNPTGSESNRKRDLSDGIHTNASGGKKLGEFIAREVIHYFVF